MSIRQQHFEARIGKAFLHLCFQTNIFFLSHESEPLPALFRSIVTFTDATEAAVLVSKEEGPDLLHNVERDTNDDQQSRSAHQHPATASTQAKILFENFWQDRDDSQEHGTDERDALQVKAEIVDGVFARTNAADKKARLLEVIRQIVEIKRDGNIEEGKANDQPSWPTLFRRLESPEFRPQLRLSRQWQS